MAIDVDALTDFTWAQIKVAAKHAMVRAAVGGATLSINGRSFGSISITEAKLLYETADQMEQDETAESAGGIALVQFGEAQ
jgi:hypothetical protein